MACVLLFVTNVTAASRDRQAPPDSEVERTGSNPPRRSVVGPRRQQGQHNDERFRERYPRIVRKEDEEDTADSREAREEQVSKLDQAVRGLDLG